MFEKLKKKSFHYSLISTVIFFILGAVLLVLNLNNARYTLFGCIDFVSLEPEEIKEGQMVETDFVPNFGCYWKRYEKSKSGSKYLSCLYYAIRTGDFEDIESEKYMGICVFPGDEKALENMYKEPAQFSGKIRKMDEEELEYFYEHLEDFGLTKKEIEKSSLPYYIDCRKQPNPIYVFAAVAGLLLIAWSVRCFVKGKNGGFLKKLYKTFSDAGVSEATAVADFNAATSITKKETIRIGRLFTYYDLNTKVPKAIANKKIEWAYQNSTTHYRNGVQTGTTYSVITYIEAPKRKSLVIHVPNEAAANDVLAAFGQRFPWILLGYSEEIRKSYIKNHAEFAEKRKEILENAQYEEQRHPVEPSSESDSSTNNTMNN